MENDKESLATCKLSWKEVKFTFIRAGLQFGAAFHIFAESHVSLCIPNKLILIVESRFPAMGVGIDNLGK